MAEINQSTGKRTLIKLDMTPMVDLAFLLLTFFILTTSLIKNQVMEIRVPEKDDKAKGQVINDKKVVNLILGADDKIFWYRASEKVVAQTDYSSDGIRQVLLQLNSSIKDMVLIIKPSEQSRYQNLVDILDEMKISDISRYFLVDITDDDLSMVQAYSPD